MSDPSDTLSYVTLPDPRPDSSRQLPPLTSPQPQSELDLQPESTPVQEHRTFTQTLTDGLGPLTELILSNRSDLEEVKQLVYGRYAKEDECREKCRAQCRELKDVATGLAERMRAGDNRSGLRTEAGLDGDQMDRLLQDLSVLRAERQQIIRQHMEGIREMQNHQTQEIIHAVRRAREQSRSQQQRGTSWRTSR